MKVRFISYFTYFLAFTLSFFAVGYSKTSLVLLQEQEKSTLLNATLDSPPPLYLPRREAVRAVTLGYEHFTSTLLWFVTLNYFGENFESKGRLPWFSHMCELVTSLDSKARHVYEFCGTLMSWVAREPRRSTDLLSEGIKADPSYWRYFYLRAFNYWYFLEDFEKARRDLEVAAGLEGAPAFIASLASRLMAQGDQLEYAIAFLRASIENSSDANAKSALGIRLNEALTARDIRLFEGAISKFFNTYGFFPETLEILTGEGFLTSVPLDPFGDEYKYYKETGEVYSLRANKGLYFPGKTAKTGLAKKEGWESDEN
ncbi:MAG TPA: hypothetical protein PKA63_07200 [Oligoflexia bacterium]|nr:hypothetical protein [Oligoflexia bacterium]HMP48435.1 hypothetical protein [Oligoflexia bacterium]